jgi:hypothetical protein
MFLRNDGWFSTDYMALYPTRQISSQTVWEPQILHAISYCHLNHVISSLLVSRAKCSIHLSSPSQLHARVDRKLLHVRLAPTNWFVFYKSPCYKENANVIPVCILQWWLKSDGRSHCYLLCLWPIIASPYTWLKFTSRNRSATIKNRIILKPSKPLLFPPLPPLNKLLHHDDQLNLALCQEPTDLWLRNPPTRNHVT